MRTWLFENIWYFNWVLIAIGIGMNWVELWNLRKQHDVDAAAIAELNDERARCFDTTERILDLTEQCQQGRNDDRRLLDDCQSNLYRLLPPELKLEMGPPPSEFEEEPACDEIEISTRPQPI